MRLLIDAVGIREGGGASVLAGLLRGMTTVRPSWEIVVALLPPPRRSFGDSALPGTVRIEHISAGDSGVGRIHWVRHLLPRRLSLGRFDVLLSFANLAPTRAVTPQVVFLQQMKAIQADVSGLSVLRRFRFRIMRRLALSGARSSRAVVVQTQSMRARLLELAPDLTGRVHVIPSAYRPAASVPRVRAELSDLVERCTGPLACYPALPYEHKNHATLLAAVPAIRAVLPDWRLVLTLDLAALASRNASPWQRRLASTILPYVEQGAVACVGRLAEDEVDWLLRRSSAMVFPSVSESFGLPLVEAMAAGCPVVAADLPYTREVCEEAAERFDPTNARSLANSVIRVASDPSRREELARRGRERAAQFDYRTIAERFAVLIEDAIQSCMR